MQIIAFLKKLFLGSVLIATSNSPINGKLTIYEDLFGHRWLKAGVLTESGGIMETIMDKAFKEVKKVRTQPINQALLLGLGAGTVVKRIRSYWPEVKIKAVDLDPIMLEIGKKYFNVDNNPNIELLVGDAIIMVNDHTSALWQDNQKHQIKYDLIVIDLYLETDFPIKKIQEKHFLDNLKCLLADKGMVVINRLYWGYHRQDTDDIVKTYSAYFPICWVKRATASNRLIFCHF